MKEPIKDLLPHEEPDVALEMPNTETVVAIQEPVEDCIKKEQVAKTVERLFFKLDQPTNEMAPKETISNTYSNTESGNG